MSLIYRRKFWDFYKANLHDVDRLLWSAVWSVTTRYPDVDAEDVRSEVLLRLHNSNFLDKFDSTKSQLVTYFTQKAYNYARHVVNAEVDERRNFSSLSATTAVLENEPDENDSYVPRPVQGEVILPTTAKKPIVVGNGHKSQKIRDLTEKEKELIQKKLFMPANGMIGADACVKFRAKYFPAEVTIFQITGCIVSLHRKVAQGLLNLRDMSAYEKFIRSHRNLWKTYDSPRYQAMRKTRPADPSPILKTVEFPDIDESLDLDGLMKTVGDRLDKTSKQILNYRLDGFTCKEVGKKLNVEPHAVFMKYKKIMTIVTSVYKRLHR